MTRKPRTIAQYGGRETVAARRVLVDVAQVLAPFFRSSIVLVGGWVPELLLHDAEPPHSGSIDVDLALDAEKLREGRYADLVELLLSTGRYQWKENRKFALQAQVALGDDGPEVLVDVEFMKSPRMRFRSVGRLPDFRPFDADGCEAAFVDPRTTMVSGRMITGAENTVMIRVPSVPDFLIMKAHALAGRDKSKDAYDICFCLENAPGGIDAVADNWRGRQGETLVDDALRYLRDKFRSVRSFGPRQVVAFHAAGSAEEDEMHARRAYELVSRLLELVRGDGR